MEVAPSDRSAQIAVANIKYYINAVFSPIGVIFNILLLYLIINHSNRSLKNYKKVLILSSTSDAVYALFNALCSPSVTIIQGTHYFIFLEGYLGEPPYPLPSYAYVLNIFLMYFIITIPMTQFVYRYCMLCREVTLKTTGFLTLSSVGFLASIINALFWVTSIRSKTVSDYEYARQILIASQWRTERELNGSFGFVFIEDLTRMVPISFPLVALSYSVVCVCAVAIYLKLKEVQNQISATIVTVQNQITFVLVIEAAIPFISMVCPMSFDILLVFLQKPVPWAGRVVFTFAAVAPVMNSLAKLLIISCYRRWLLRVVRLGRYTQNVGTNEALPVPPTRRTGSGGVAIGAHAHADVMYPS